MPVEYAYSPCTYRAGTTRSGRCPYDTVCWRCWRAAPEHGYQLRAEFERRTGAAWPLNVGQVYTTLARLERDGCVAQRGENGDGQKSTGHRRRALTRSSAWFTTPVAARTPPRDELAIKLALAVTAPGVDVAAVLQAQRTDSMRALQDYTRLKPRPRARRADLAWSLVLDALVFSAEAEVRWLDHCEGRLVAARAAGRWPAGTGRAAPP